MVVEVVSLCLLEQARGEWRVEAKEGLGWRVQEVGGGWWGGNPSFGRGWQCGVSRGRRLRKPWCLLMRILRIAQVLGGDELFLNGFYKYFKDKAEVNSYSIGGCRMWWGLCRCRWWFTGSTHSVEAESDVEDVISLTRGEFDIYSDVMPHHCLRLLIRNAYSSCFIICPYSWQYEWVLVQGWPWLSSLRMQQTRAVRLSLLQLSCQSARAIGVVNWEFVRWGGGVCNTRTIR